MNDFINEILKHGFMETGRLATGVRVFYTVVDDTAYVFCLADDAWLYDNYNAEGVNIAERYNILDRQIRALFNEKYYKGIVVHNIIVADNAFKLHDSIIIDDSYWVVEKASGRLIIYESQPADFAGIKSFLEESLDKGTVRNKPKQYVYTPHSIFTVTNLIILFNIVIYIITAANGDVYDANYLIDCGGLVLPVSWDNFYRVFTCNFLHAGLEHLAVNMLLIFFIGNIVEEYMGMLPYIFLYLAGCLGSSLLTVLHYSMTYTYNTVTVGASGAAFALIGAFITAIITDSGMRKKFSLRGIIMYALIVLVSGFASGGGIANFGHLGGFIAGIIYSAVFALL